MGLSTFAHRAVLSVALCVVPLTLAAQTASLGDIRAELGQLSEQLETLRAELRSTGAAASLPVGTLTDRINAMEQRLQQLTAQTEGAEFRVEQVTRDAGLRMGDLEFRLCELEPHCDIASLGSGATDQAPPSTTATPQPSLVVGEARAFQAAKDLLAEGRFKEAADAFGRFVQSYPGGPMSGQAGLLRAEALAGTGDMTAAARAYLDSFSADPNAPEAPASLFGLGAALGELGQVQEACLTLAEVPARYPEADVVADARAISRSLQCS